MTVTPRVCFNFGFTELAKKYNGLICNLTSLNQLDPGNSWAGGSHLGLQAALILCI